MVVVSPHLIKTSLVIWGLSSVSLIKLTFFLIAVKSELTVERDFHHFIFNFTVIFASIYLFLQTIYNISFVDVFFKSLGSKLDSILLFIGLYKYYRFDEGVISISDIQQDALRVKIERFQGMALDFLSFATYLALHNLSET